MTTRRFPVIEASGGPYDLGYQHGHGHRDLVLHSLSTFRRILSSANPLVEFEEAAAMAREALPVAEARAPELMEEVRGLADGAGLSFDEVFTLNASLDVLSLLAARQFQAEPAGCSTYGVTTPATADGETYVGWNADDLEWWLPSCVLQRFRPAGGLPCLMWNFAGFVGRPGINPYLALTANGLRSTEGGLGLPYPFVCRKGLAQRTVDDAILAITSAPRLSGMNYMLGDSEGTLASLELMGSRYAAILPRGGWVVHTNNYVDPGLRSSECLDESTRRCSSTTTRLRRWQEMMQEKAGSITMATLQCMHRDHAHAPFAVCRHTANGDYSTTLTSLICLPQRGRMWVAYNPPCENEFVEYAL